jgi:hypothetical protein
MAAKAHSLRNVLDSLSPSAMEAIKKRRGELDAQEKARPKPSSASSPHHRSSGGSTPESHATIPTRRGRN